MNISLIIPAYNCEKTIEDSLESVLNKNLIEGDEIIIVDDGSTDNTLSIIKKIVSRHKNIHIFRHSHNKGGGAARNTAVEKAKNSLIFCLDSDNILVPGSVQKLKSHLLISKADIACFSHIRFFTDSVVKYDETWCYHKETTSLMGQLTHSPTPGASGNYLFTKDSWKKAGGYPESAGALDTWGLGFRQIASGSVLSIMPNSFYYHRRGHESYWIRDSKKNNHSIVALQIILPYLDLLDPKFVEYIFAKKNRHNWFDNIPQEMKMSQGSNKQEDTNVFLNLRDLISAMKDKIKPALCGNPSKVIGNRLNKK